MVAAQIVGRSGNDQLGAPAAQGYWFSRPLVAADVPAFMASDPAHTLSIGALYAKGNTLLIGGRPLEEARALYEQLTKTYPDSQQAGLASQLGVAVGSVNWYLKRLVRKGYEIALSTSCGCRKKLVTWMSISS